MLKFLKSIVKAIIDFFSGSKKESDDLDKPTPKKKQQQQQEEVWADENEPFKFVCEGGKVKCEYHASEVEIKPTSTQVMLQDKPYATTEDKDGKTNFTFTSVCTHPKWKEKPPCLSVISLKEWKDFSETKIDNYNALLHKSTIPCSVSGKDLKITHSGQKSDIDPVYEKDNGTLLSIDLLEGNTPLTSAEVLQYVNLPQDTKYVNNGISHIDRLGRKLRLQVKFKRKGKFKFTITLKSHTLSTYTANEKGKNANFEKYTDSADFFEQTDENGIVTIGINHTTPIWVTPAGNDVFEVKAKDSFGNEATAPTKVKTNRRLYYMEAKMAGLTTITPDLNTVVAEYAKHGISLVGYPSVSTTFIENIDTSNQSAFLSNLTALLNASTCGQLVPYSLIIGYTGHLAVKSAPKDFDIVNIILGNGGITQTKIGIEIGSKKYPLWDKIVSGEDYFVECYFLKDGDPLTNKISILKTECTPSKLSGYSAYEVTIDLTRITTLVTSSTDSTLPISVKGKVVLCAYYVDRMRGGLSGGSSSIVVCTKAYWQNESATSQQQVTIHELGHSVKMVTKSHSNLDQTPNFYTGSGHIGDHCHAGVSAMANYSGATGSTCVMFGATNGKSAFCTDCAKAVKKLDLSGGL